MPNEPVAWYLEAIAAAPFNQASRQLSILPATTHPMPDSHGDRREILWKPHSAGASATLKNADGHSAVLSARAVLSISELSCRRVVLPHNIRGSDRFPDSGSPRIFVCVHTHTHNIPTYLPTYLPIYPPTHVHTYIHTYTRIRYDDMI